MFYQVLIQGLLASFLQSQRERFLPKSDDVNIQKDGADFMISV